MAAIGKIREKSWLLLIVVGGAMIAFILSMVYGTGGGGAVEDNIGIGTVNGVKVEQKQYDQFVINAKNNTLQRKYQQNPNQQPQLSEQDIQSAKRQAWITITTNQLMQKEYKSIGLIVDNYELDNVLYGENGYLPNPGLAAQFKDSITGEFSPEQLKQALQQLQNATDAQSLQQYQNIIDYVRESRLQTKYLTLLKAGVHATAVEGKNEYKAKKTVKNVAYVYQSYTKAPKDAVKKPTEEEVKAYYEEHKTDNEYEQSAHRKLAYFTIPIKASADDSLKALTSLEQLVPRFTKTSKDSIFVLRFSDVKLYASDSTAAARPASAIHQGPSYPDSLSDQMKNAQLGDVIGPYFSRAGATLSKVIGFYTENTATVRHILLKANTPEAYETAQKKADSLVEVIKSQDNFVEMVKEFSEDAPSVVNGGKYTEFTEGTMVKPFSDFSFNQPVGTIGTVKTNYGIHVVKVLEHGPTKRPILAQVVKIIKTSRTTVDRYETIASNYIYDLYDKFEGKTPEQMSATFDTLAIQNGYTVQYITIEDETPSVSGFSDIAEGNVLELAYKGEPKIGNLSSSPIHNKVVNRGREQQQMVVAYLADIVKKGVPSYLSVKSRMEAQLMKDKQAQYIKDQMAGAKDLQALAEKMDAQYKTEGLTFSASNVAVGQEPKIIGVAFSGLSDGQTSVPVQGKNGAFVLKIIKTTPAEPTTDYSAEVGQIEQALQTDIQNKFSNALRKSADIVDNRKLRQFNIR